MGKRGRKANTEKEPNKTGYFYEEEEAAVVKYVTSKNQEERDLIFKKYLLKPFTKMVESIIRRYNLYIPYEDFKETFDDTMSYMVSKLDDFKIDSGFKAYSFCGTVAKNYMLMRIANFNKLKIRYPSFDAMIEENGGNIKANEDRSDEEDRDVEPQFIKKLFECIADDIERDIKNYDNPEMTEDFRKVGEALIVLLHNWDELLQQNGSNKFNKSEIILFIKDYTSLNTKQINQAMNYFKALYFNSRRNFVNKYENLN